MNPLWTLAPASLLLGAALVWAFRRLTSGEAIGREVDRIQAHLLEFWLFTDEPALAPRFWADLLKANLRLLRHMALALIVMSAPMAPLYFWLDSVYGYQPLAVNEPSVVTARFNAGADAGVLPALEAPEGILVDNPPVRIPATGEVSWRIRPVRPAAGALRCMLAARTFTKSVSAAPGLHPRAPVRSRSPFARLVNPTEARLEDGPLAALEVGYPRARVGVLGFEADWTVWFVLFSAVGAVAALRFSSGAST